jgi:hypothetical protein
MMIKRELVVVASEWLVVIDLAIDDCFDRDRRWSLTWPMMMSDGHAGGTGRPKVGGSAGCNRPPQIL